MGMFGPAEYNADEKWVRDWKNLGVMPEITVEEKIAQGKALRKSPEVLCTQSSLAAMAQPWYPEPTEMLRAHALRNLGVLPGITVEEKIAQGKALQPSPEMLRTQPTFAELPNGSKDQESKEMFRAR